MKKTTYFNKNFIALTAICLASLMFGLEISSVPVILPTLEKVLHGDFKDMQWIMNAYTIACTTVLMATGTLADRYGRKRVFIISLTVFGITSLICGLAQNVTVLIVSRFLQGMGGGAMLICQIAILSHQFRAGAERGRAFGIWGIVFGIGLGFGPIIGGMIVAVSNWQWVFLVHVLITALTLLLVFSGIAESRDPQAGKVDIAGIVTLSLAVFGLTYYITQGPEIGFFSTTGYLMIALVVIFLVAFVVAEKMNPHPMFDFSVFRIRHFSGALLGAMAMNFSFWPFMIYLPVYFQSGLGYDSITAGLALLAYTLPTLVFPPLGERLSLRFQPGVVIPAGLFIIGAGFMLMRYGGIREDASWLTMLPGSLLAGIGLGITNTLVTNTTTGAVPASRAGMASGIDMSARLIALAVNIALMGFILLAGILTYLKAVLPASLDTQQLHAAAAKIAAGSSDALPALPGGAALDPTGNIVHAALLQGFDGVMLYGGISIWLLAVISLIVFGIRRPVSAVAGS
ncbi:MFS transporter [Chitinophaga nivalis]|uniref:MFS transporter n=1 Tax=Chitinophaga nivalis TaxID=2991709 RepID=A0ABT3IT40_9BACT|nr:MFS transporter [Chitinophaga nivalis]MCW3463170.1 MFS transporter [Chitinophaga nivalis]MCW3487140.1 MFS transporter [Chitinophaga nivalis]